MLKDEEVISKLDLTSGKLYFKDLGPQVGWSTVSTVFYPTSAIGEDSVAPMHSFQFIILENSHKKSKYIPSFIQSPMTTL